MVRIAFVTPVFVTDYLPMSGPSNYLARITHLMKAAGHDVEIFTASSHQAGELDFQGVKVHRVRVVSESFLYKLSAKIASLFGMYRALKSMLQSWKLCRALELRHAAYPFDAVQYTDLFALGFFMKRRPGRKNILRCCRAVELYTELGGRKGFFNRINEWLEVCSIRRADVRYAPSRYVADFYSKRHGITMQVVRSPLDPSDLALGDSPFGLPSRYFIHFGALGLRKGTFWLIDALKLALKVDPSILVIMVGEDSSNELADRLAMLGEFRRNVLVLHPLPKNELYSLLKRARAAILPSLVDNLPNAVIESLQLGVPVIGSNGASIDEIVQEGATGELAELGNCEELADLIVRFWHDKTPVKSGFIWNGFSDEENPVAALVNLIRSR